MFLSKLKATAATLLAVGVVISGVGLYARQVPGPDTKPITSTLPSANPVVRARLAEDVDGIADEIEQLVRRARQEQAQGDIEGAVRDLDRVELGARRWSKALTNLQRSEAGTLPGAGRLPAEKAPPRPGDTPPVQPRISGERLPIRPEARAESSGASKPRIAEQRLDELERKVERILVALEKPAPKPPRPAKDARQDAEPAEPPPPALQGRLTKVNSLTGRVEINIGSDDGLARGHVLSVYRAHQSKPSSAEPVYVGRIRILSIDPDQAVAEIIDRLERERFEEGNLVSPRTEPDKE
jgi:hypothetical protein